MSRILPGGIVLGALLAIGQSTLAQEPCATVTAQGASLRGFAGAKADTLKSGSNTICDMWAKDRTAKLTLIAEPPQPASALAMRRMLAANAKEPGMKVRDEPSLGAGAFSFATKDQVSLTAAGKGGVYTVSLNRDAGISDGDETQVRMIAKRILEIR